MSYTETIILKISNKRLYREALKRTRSALSVSKRYILPALFRYWFVKILPLLIISMWAYFSFIWFSDVWIKMQLFTETSPNIFINQWQWTKFENNAFIRHLWSTWSITTRNHLCFQIKKVFVVARVNRKRKYVDFRPSAQKAFLAL